MKRMLSLIAVAGLIALPVAAQDEMEEEKSGSDLKKLLGTAAEYENYTFTSTSKTEGMPKRGGGGGQNGNRGALTPAREVTRLYVFACDLLSVGFFYLEIHRVHS